MFIPFASVVWIIICHVRICQKFTKDNWLAATMVKGPPLVRGLGLFGESMLKLAPGGQGNETWDHEVTCSTPLLKLGVGGPVCVGMRPNKKKMGEANES